MFKLYTLKQLNKVLVDIFDTKFITNGDIVNLVRASIVNYNINNNKDWIMESKNMKKIESSSSNNVYFDIDSKYDSENKLRISKTNNYELSLLKWGCKQKALFHTPSRSYRFLVPLYGSLLETHYEFINISNYSYTHIITTDNEDDILKKYSKDIIKCNELVLPIYDISYLDNNVSIHCIENNTPREVIALHINISRHNNLGSV
jgi:hypothetical protein